MAVWLNGNALALMNVRSIELGRMTRKGIRSDRCM